MRRGLSARMLAASVLLGLVVCGVFALLLLSINDLRDSARRARHSEEVLAAATRLENLVIDLETGHRAYVITHSERFLEPWQRARRRYPAATRQLEGLVADEPAQAERARTIGHAIASYYTQYSLPLVELTRRSKEDGRAFVATGEGKKRVDAIRAQFARFAGVEKSLSDRRREEANADGRRAIGFGIGGIVASLLLVIGFALYLGRVLVRPVRRVAGAASRLAGGDLSARVVGGGPAEIGELAQAFNAMAGSLEESRDELESQNAELELQTAELEDQQARLEAANDELQAQQTELARAVEQLDEEKQRVETFYEFAERIAGDAEVDALALTMLGQLCEAGGAESGLLYALDEQGDGARFVPVASVGFDRARLPEDVVAGEGLAGRALLERRSIVADHGQTGLKVRAFGDDVSVGAELHVPLLHGERVLGVVTLARLAPRPFSADDRQLIEHLAAQAAVALANALAFRTAVRQASINHAVLDSTTDAIAMVDLDGRTVVANRATAAVAESHGLTPGGGLFAAGATIRDRVTDPETYAASIERLVADPEAEFEFEYELKDSGRSFKTYTAPVRVEDAAPIGRILVIRETTAEREAERLKSELVATVSHELRTPLASILGFAELMVQRELDAATRSRYLETIYGEAQRLTALINDFLDLQRIEAGRLELSLQPFELGRLLEEQVALFSAQSAAHRLELALPSAPLQVYADHERATQVVANLLSNAIKYSPGGGEVRVAAAEQNGVIRVEVRDQGVGIPPEQQSRIFTKFFRVDSSDTREIGGTGLGLALAQEIVAAQGGRIGFDSVPGEGTTFWFELPSAERRNGGARALVVEDDAATAALLVEHLRLEGLQAHVAVSGEEALEFAAEDPPLVICLDIGLAGKLDGWQVLARLKAAPATAHVPVLVCSARNGREDAAALGAADYLAKPFSGRELRATLQRLLPERGGRVLIVDDEPAVRELVVASLSGDGLELEEAADGEAALASVARRRPDAIVLDLMLPALDGFAVLERLQADPRTRDIPVVVLTARRLGAREREHLSARALALLEKSAYSGEELRRLIRRALGRAR